MAFSWVTVGVVVIYLAATSIYGLWLSRRAGAAQDFSQIRLSWWESAALLTAFTLGSSATYGIAGDAAKFGLTYLIWFPASIAVGWVVTGLLFAGPYHRLGGVSLSQWLEQRFDGRVSLATTISIMAYSLFVVLLQIYTLSLIMRSLFPALGPGAATAVSLLVCAGSVALSGALGVSRLSIVHTVTVLGAFAIALVMLLLEVGGWRAALPAVQASLPLFSTQPVDFPRWLSPVGMGWGVVAQFMLGKAGRLGGISMLSDVAGACRSPREARLSYCLAGFFGAAPSLMAGLVGILTMAYLGGRGAELPVYSAIGLGLSQISPLAAGLLLAAIAASVLGAYGPSALLFNSILIKDLLRRYLPTEGRAARILYPAGILLLSAACALYISVRPIQDMLPFVYTTVMPCTAPVTVVCLFGLYVPGATARSAFAAILLGLAASLAWGLLLGNPWGVPNLVPACAVPAVVMGLDLLLAPRPARVGGGLFGRHFVSTPPARDK